MQFMKPRRPGRGTGCCGLPSAIRGHAVLAGFALAVTLTAGCGQGAGTDADETAASSPGESASGQEAGTGAEQSALPDDAAKASYSLGYRFAENVSRQFSGAIESESFVQGVRDQLEGEEAQVSDEESDRVLQAMMEERQAQAANVALENLEAGLAFLEQNAQREGVTALESGLQYEVLEEGDGPKPDADDVVTTHYEGRLVDGTVFDSSYQRGQPATFPLNRVIPGWTEGLQLMSPGAKYRLYVPSELAYGERSPDPIPPNSTLVFDVELLEVQSNGAAAQEGGSEAASEEPAGGSREDSGD